MGLLPCRICRVPIENVRGFHSQNFLLFRFDCFNKSEGFILIETEDVRLLKFTIELLLLNSIKCSLSREDFMAWGEMMNFHFSLVFLKISWNYISKKKISEKSSSCQTCFVVFQLWSTATPENLFNMIFFFPSYSGWD